jgi:predicted small metal-binding protein
VRPVPEHVCPECGAELTADDEDELLTLSIRHFSEEHPDATPL